MCTSACPSAPRPHAPAPLPPLPQVARWEPAFCGRDPVLAALHGLFAQLERQEAARSAAAAGGNGGSLPPVDPGPLREALAALPGQSFRLGGWAGVGGAARVGCEGLAPAFAALLGGACLPRGACLHAAPLVLTAPKPCTAAPFFPSPPPPPQAR